MRRAIEVFNGNDAVVRSAIIKKPPLEVKLPVAQLAPVLYDGVSEKKTRLVVSNQSVTIINNMLQKKAFFFFCFLSLKFLNYYFHGPWCVSLSSIVIHLGH